LFVEIVLHGTIGIELTLAADVELVDSPLRRNSFRGFH
jgi:hypothetical protein